MTNKNYSTRDTSTGKASKYKTENSETKTDFIKQVVAESRTPSFYNYDIDSFDIGDVFNSDFGCKIQFGRWLSNNWRLSYGLLILFLLNDMGSILHKISPKLYPKKNEGYNLGRGVLTISMGANGDKAKRSWGFYQSDTNIINFRRHGRFDKLIIDGLTDYNNSLKKDIGFKNSSNSFYNLENLQPYINRINFYSGIHAFCHEFGHFIDFGILGTGTIPMSGYDFYSFKSPKLFKDSVISKPITNPLFKELVLKLLLTNSKEPQWSKFGERMETINLKQKSYFYKSVELWARIYEVFIYYKLQSMGISYLFSNGKYEKKENSKYYATRDEIKKVEPIIVKILKGDKK